MKKLISLISVLMISYFSFGQDVNLVWAKKMGSTDVEVGYSLAVDASGNVYTTGQFQGTVDFDPGPGTFNLVSAGSASDIFITKLDASGDFVWAKKIGAGFDDFGLSIAVDASGNVYTTGSFRGTVDFDPGAGTSNLTCPGTGEDIFISKLNASGNLVWAKNMGGTSHDGGRSIAVDASSNVYTTGVFSRTADFDPGPGTYNLTSAGVQTDVILYDIFVSKLDASGNFVWAKNMGGASEDWGLSIAVDASGNVYTTGFFTGIADFDPGPGTSNLTSGGNDIFISKLDASGNFVWAKKMGGTSTNIGYSIAVDASGNVYTTGYFQGIVDFDPGAGTSNLTGGGNDIFISKLDASGNFVWAKKMGGTSTDIGYSIAVDASGNVYTTGSFQGTADFDPGTGTYNLTAAGINDIFISKLDASGNFVWAKKMGGISTDIGYSIAVDASGNVYTTGQFFGTADFDPGTGTYNLTSAGIYDIFVAKFIQESVDAPPTITSFSPSSGPVGISLTITGTNFNVVPANNIVYFGAVKATVTSGTTTSLTVTAPAGATYQPISVLDNNTGLTGYSSKPFIITFTNPFGTGIPANFYKPKIDISTGDQSACLAMGDVDGDGKPDLVVANWNSSTISVLRNISTSGNISAASFAAKVDFATWASPSTIAIGDVDGDGKPDIVVGYRYSENVSVLRNTSTSGSISASSLAAKVDFVTGDVTVSVAIGDIDGDGKPEIMVANLYALTVSVFRNTSSPGSISMSSFAARVDFPVTSNPSFVAIGDVDGDSKPDLVVANYGAYSISVLRNTSTSGNINALSFAPKVDFGTGPNPYSVAISDVDGDGKPDLAVVNVGTNTMYLFRNTSTSGSINASSFAAAVDFDLGNQSVYVAIGDVDGDGKPDVVSVHQYSHKITVLRNISTSGIINTSSFASRVEFVTGLLPSSVAIGDLDGDGKPEIAASNMSINTVSVFQISSATTITCPDPVTAPNDPGVCGATVTGIAPTVTNGAPPYVTTYTITGATTNTGIGDASGTFFNTGLSTVTYTIGNAEVNSATCSFTVTVNDTQLPTITCPAATTVGTNIGCTYVGSIGTATGTDNCGSFGNALSFAGGFVNVPNAPILNPFNEWTLETWVRRTNTGVQESLIEKYNEPPSTTGYLLRILGTNKAMAGFVFGSFAGYFITGTTTILPNTWYHLATTFNRTTGVMKLYVNGVLDAQVTGMVGLPTLPNNASLKLGARGDDAATRLTNGGIMDEIRIWSVERTQAQILANMNSELNAQAGLVALYHLNQGIAGGNNAGLTTVIDGSGNNNNGTLLGFALTGPTSNWVSGLLSGSGPVVTNNAPATYPIGNTTVTWTATDASGNSATCSQVVTVVDNQAPVLTCPGNQSFNVIENTCAANYTIVDPISDNCAGATWGYTLSGATTGTVSGIADGTGSGSLSFNKGITTVTLNGKDAVNNNAVSCSFTITVTDNEKPKITCNAPIVVNNNPGVCGAAVSYSVTSSDNCPGQVVTQTAGLASGSIFPVGVTTNSFLVTDASGNIATCSFTVTVNDNEAPVSSAAASFNIYSGFYTYNGTTNKSVLDAQIASQTQLGHQSINCINSFQDPFYPASSSHGYYITVPFTEATAANFSFRLGADFGGGGVVFLDGNYLIGKTGDLWWNNDWNNPGVLAAFNIPVSAGNHILEIYGWEICCFGAMSIQLDLNADGIWDCAGSLPTVTAQCSATVTAPTALDNCAGLVTGTTTDPTTYTTQGSYTVHWTFNDGHGNSSTANQTVIVNDVTPPVITCPTNIIQTADAGLCSYSFNPTAATATDNCPGVTVAGVRSDAKPLSDPYPVGVTTITWTATDAHNQSVSCDQAITVTDYEKPVITVQDIFKCFADDNSGCTINLGATATDNCGVLSLTSNALACFPVGTTTVTWTVIDSHGNSNTATQTVTRNPEINIDICAGPTLRIYTGTTSGAGPFGPQSVNLASNVTGGTPGYTYSWSPAAGLNDPTSANPVASPTVTTTYTLTVTDSKGCTRSLSITIEVLPLSDAVCYGTGNNIKYAVCHIPPGLPSNPQNICISESALNAHLVSGSYGHNNCYLGPCGQQLCFSTTADAPSLVSATSSAGKGKTTINEEIRISEFSLKANPNPSTHSFNVRVESLDQHTPIHIRIINISGQIMENRNNIIQGQAFKIGEDYRPGTYLIEALQGKQRKTMKLVKLPN